MKSSDEDRHQDLCVHMIVVEKDESQVIDGSSQDQELYPDKSSPRVAILSVIAMLARISTRLSWATITRIDIKGAYAQTPMEGSPKIDHQISNFIIALYPDFN